MQILDYAMKMEKDGEAYYRDLVSRCDDVGLGRILEKMAGSEVKHYETLQRLRDDLPADMADDIVRADARNLFEQMVETGERFDFAMSELALYEKGRDIEKQSRDYYLAEADNVGSDQGRELFLRLAKEEDLHFQLLDSIVDFVARPESWIENAEWYHSEDY